MSTYNDASLIYYPSGYKASKAYSLKPTDGSGDLTFTRASTATRVNEQGLIEGVRTNLLLQSNSFDTTWVNANSTNTSGQNGYDGTNDAWLLTKTNASGRITQTKSISGVFTFSVYLKKGTNDWVLLYKTGTGEGGRYFDLTNGVIGSSVAAAPIDSKIEQVGATDWYRCSIVGNSATAVVIYVADANGVTSGTSGNIYIQDAQLEASVQATEYIPTTTTAVSVGMLANVPRIDYTSGCGKLLLEPQRTNLWLYSRASLTWLKSFWTTTDNYALSPNGAVNAFRAVSTNNSGILYLNGIGTTGVNNTLSVYAKSNTGTNQNFRLFGNGNSITSGEFVATTEWQRFTFTYNCTNITSGIKASATMLSDLLFSDFQHEAGDYATSVIPTSGTAVTRVADSASKSGISSLIGQTEGTLFVEFNIDGDISGNRSVITLSSGSSVDFIASFIFNNLFYARIRANNGTLIDVTKSGLTSGVHKVAIGYAANDLTFYLDGVLVGQNTSASVAFANPLSVVRIAENTAAINQLGDGINSAMLFTTRLDNATLATLTTL